MLRQELEALGLLVSCHPLLPYRKQLVRLQRIEAAELKNWAGRYVTLVGWWVTGKVVQTHKGQPMEFITFEDTSASYDTTFIPRAYARFCRKVSRARPYLLKGKWMKSSAWRPWWWSGWGLWMSDSAPSIRPDIG